jgi:flagellar motor switch protein FliN/FliY
MDEQLNSANPEQDPAGRPVPPHGPDGEPSEELVQELREAAGAEEHRVPAEDAASDEDDRKQGADRLMHNAMMAESAADEPEPMRSDLEQTRMPTGPATVQRAEFDTLHKAERMAAAGSNIDLLMDVNLPVSIELGRTELSISELLELGAGSIVELDKLAGEPVDILVNNKPLAKGEVVVLDEHFGVRITSLVSRRERLEGLSAG